MSDEPYASAIAIAASAYKICVATTDAESLAAQKEADEKRTLSEAESRRARLIELDDADGALRHLDGDEAAPPKPQRTKAIASLNEKIPQIRAAIPVLAQRTAAAKREREAAQLPFTGAIMQAISLIQEPAAERIRTVLAELEEPLRDLLAADMIQAGTIGERYPMPAGAKPPFNGGILVRKLLGAIPPRLLPETLAATRIEGRARAAAVAAICEIKETRK